MKQKFDETMISWSGGSGYGDVSVTGEYTRNGVVFRASTTDLQDARPRMTAELRGRVEAVIAAEEASQPKKVWVVQVDVRTSDLEDHLNARADDGYTIHSVTKAVNDTWTVIAYDTTRIMEKSTAALMQQMSALTPLGASVPGLPPNP